MKQSFLENSVARQVVDVAYQIHTQLGPGLLESVYQAVMCHELRARGRDVRSEVPVPVQYGKLHFNIGFRVDIVVDGCVLVELKSVERTCAVHKKQILTYIRLSGVRLGLLINFGAARIKDGITRVANGMPDE
jgi:GxxExxY protein